MSAARASVRAAVKKRLFDVLTAAIAPERAAVLYGPARQLEEGDQVIVGPVAGLDTTVPTFKAGRKQRHDEFTVSIICTAWLAGQNDQAAADERVDELAELVMAELVADVSLGDLPGVVAATPTQIDGPDSWPGELGVGAGMRILVTVTARIN